MPPKRLRDALYSSGLSSSDSASATAQSDASHSLSLSAARNDNDSDPYADSWLEDAVTHADEERGRGRTSWMDEVDPDLTPPKANKRSRTDAAVPLSGSTAYTAALSLFTHAQSALVTRLAKMPSGPRVCRGRWRRARDSMRLARRVRGRLSSTTQFKTVKDHQRAAPVPRSIRLVPSSLVPAVLASSMVPMQSGVQ